MASNKVQEVLDEYNIPYITSGRNVRKGNYNINCPFCAQDDGYHMGLVPDKGWYGCWRDSKHRGRNFAKVVQALLNVSWREAQALASDETTLESEDELTKLVNSLFDENIKDEEIKLGGQDHLDIPKEFKEIEDRGPRAEFIRYMEGRGFTDVPRLFRKYEVLCCQSGEWKKRLIFPLYHEDKLVAWQGRSIYNSATLPYKDLSIEESVRHLKNALYNYDAASMGGKVLIVCEGLMDFLKMDFYSPKGFRATCIFTKTMTSEQVYLLTHLATLYDEVWFVLDRDAQSNAEDLVAELQPVRRNIRMVELPEGIDDPGEMPVNRVKSFCEENYK